MVEHLHQHPPGPEHPALHRPGGDANRLRRLVVGEPDHSHQHHRLPQIAVETGQGVAHLHRHVRVGHRSALHQGAVLHQVNGAPPSDPPGVIGSVSGHREQPRHEQLGVAQGAQLAVHPPQHLLGDVLGQARVTNQMQHIPPDVCLHRAHQPLERGQIAARSRHDVRGIRSVHPIAPRDDGRHLRPLAFAPSSCRSPPPERRRRRSDRSLVLEPTAGVEAPFGAARSWRLCC
jgi:hypothetical protein